MDREEEYYVALLREFLRGKDVAWNNSAFSYIELRSFVGRSTMGKRDSEVEPVPENPVYGFIEGWARASRRIAEKYPQQEAPAPFEPWCFGKSSFRGWELFDQDFHVVFANPPPAGQDGPWDVTYAASAITPVDDPPAYLAIVLKPGEMDPKSVRSIVYNASRPPESYTPVSYVQSNRDLNRLQPFLRAGDITYSTFIVDRGDALWQLDRSSDGTSWLKVSDPMPPNPQRIAAVMYVRSSKFEEHIQSLPSRPVNVRELIDPYRTKSLDDPLVSCVVTMLMNSLFRGNIVPLRPAEWEEAALKRGTGTPDAPSADKEPAPSANVWMIVSIAVGSILLVAIIVGIFLMRRRSIPLSPATGVPPAPR
jgi:hypothetical protein